MRLARYQSLNLPTDFAEVPKFKGILRSDVSNKRGVDMIVEMHILCYLSSQYYPLL
jgi:hypothetical protein